VLSCLSTNIIHFNHDLSFNKDTGVNYYGSLNIPLYNLPTSHKLFKLPFFYNFKNNTLNWLCFGTILSLKYLFFYSIFIFFKFFFSNIKIDVPKELYKSKSLLRVSNYSPFLRLKNYLMRHGKSLKYIIQLNLSLNYFYTNYSSSIGVFK
jgi:hypothetical protein